MLYIIICHGVLKENVFHMNKEIYIASGISNSGNENTGFVNSGDGNSGYSNSGDSNSGYSNSGNWNSGYSNSGNWNSGDSNSGDSNSGYSNSGYWNSGNWNSGNRNSGNWNSGDKNSGDSNSGYRNSGNWNSGYWNSGNWNSGDKNSGDSNSGYRNSGAFCTDINPKVWLFDKPTDIYVKDWEKSIPFQIMSNYLNFNFWINSSEMSEDEKKQYPKHEKTGGYLKRIEYKEGWANMWGNLSDIDKSEFTKLPNFDSKIFESITGIKI
jgi:Pentapeptide repeats (8 copies)